MDLALLQNKLEESKQELAIAPSSANAELLAVSEAKKIEVSMITAKRFPRDLTKTEDTLARLCSKLSFAENAEYRYPRGGKDVSGASVKLMEAIAQQYGNVDYGVTVINRGTHPVKIGKEDVMVGYSELEAFAWDMENNVRFKRAFSVDHIGLNGKPIENERDIKELEMNYGSRYLRACLERVIPRYLVDDCRLKCNETLNSGSTTLVQRIDRAVAMFGALGVDGKALEGYVKTPKDRWTISIVNTLVKLYTSLSNGETTVEAIIDTANDKGINTEQIKQLAMLIGNDEDKREKLKAFGYDVNEIPKIKNSEFMTIYNAIANGIVDANGEVNE